MKFLLKLFLRRILYTALFAVQYTDTGQNSWYPFNMYFFIIHLFIYVYIISGKRYLFLWNDTNTFVRVFIGID